VITTKIVRGIEHCVEIVKWNWERDNVVETKERKLPDFFPETLTQFWWIRSSNGGESIYLVASERDDCHFKTISAILSSNHMESIHHQSCLLFYDKQIQ
jgi:hypothetical protein